MYKYIDRVKVLPVHRYMKVMHTKPFLCETTPKIGHNGYYLVRYNTAKHYSSWFEWDGRAWYVDPGEFLYELALQNTTILSSEQTASINKVLNMSAISATSAKDLRLVLSNNIALRSNRMTKRHFMKVKQELKRRFNGQ
jgi:hypothetical protein